MSIKPFYVYKPSREEAVEIVERIITNGGECFDSIHGMHSLGDRMHEYQYDAYPCWGFVAGKGSYTGERGGPEFKNATQLTMPQVRAMLPCEKYDGNNEWPKPGDDVVVECCGTWNAVFVGELTGSYVCRMPDDYPNGVYDGFNKISLKKPKTARENFIERTIEIIGDEEGTVEEILGRLFDAGLARDIEE